MADKKKGPSLSADKKRLKELRDELRGISMEYNDIRSRIEMTDVLIDQIIRELDIERNMRRLNLFIGLLVLALSTILLLTHLL